MMNVGVLSAFFSFCIALTSAGVIPSQDYERRLVFKGLALANNELAFNLYQRLVSESSDNVVFSPLGISTIFGILFHGVRGNAAQELRGALGYEKAGYRNENVNINLDDYLGGVVNSTDYSKGYAYRTANVIYADHQLEILDEYRNDIKKFYRETVRDVDFRKNSPRVVEEINEYVREKTSKKIEHFLNELNPSTILLLINAVYFRGVFKTRFEREETRNETFYNYGLESEGRKVLFMHLNSSLPYTYNNYYQVVELPYLGEHASMLVFLPNDRDGLQEIEENFTPEQLAQIRRHTRMTNVDISLPKFKLQFEKEMSQDMRELGANQIFENGADFTGMTHKRNVSVSHVYHKAVIEVDEEGREAASVHRTDTEKLNYIRECATFRADHPFFFAIVEEVSNVILYMGRGSNF